MKRALFHPPAQLLAIAGRVDARIDALLDAERARWSALDADLSEPVDRLAELIGGGGKRLRPAFLYWGAIGAGASASVRLDEVGAALEMLHAFALIHDDVVDDSDLRRGSPTVHVRLAERHRHDGFRGERRRFSEGLAVLIGDLAHVYADRLACELSPAARRVWDELRIELNVGQYLDLVGTARGDTDGDRARRITRYKSAKYTIERPLHLGAALAGRLDQLAAVYSAYGVPLGEAFQMRDDLLGVFGDPTVTGKPVGGDLREGKPTPLLALAVEEATPEQRTLLELVGTPQLEDDDIDRLQQILVDTGAADAIETEIAERREIAIRAIAVAPIPAEARAALVDLAAFVTARDR